METTIALTLIIDQGAIKLGKGIIYQDLQWDILLGSVSYFTSLDEKGLLNPH